MTESTDPRELIPYGVAIPDELKGPLAAAYMPISEEIDRILAEDREIILSYGPTPPPREVQEKLEAHNVTVRKLLDDFADFVRETVANYNTDRDA